MFLDRSAVLDNIDLGILFQGLEQLIGIDENTLRH